MSPALDRFTLHVPARSLTALVGPSGSGKSTVVKLLTRYADPEEGTVAIGGADLCHVRPEEVFAHVTAVFQDTFLVDDTIAVTLRSARLNASHAEFVEACRAAGCHDFVAALPDGYQTRVGEIGNQLSGGQRQRLPIARAILKDAPIVLLDEPTSALDPASELVLQRALDRLCASRTVVVVAHRLTTVVKADQICFLDAGRITERGTHDDLLAAGGRYAAMWNAGRRARDWRFGAKG